MTATPDTQTLDAPRGFVAKSKSVLARLGSASTVLTVVSLPYCDTAHRLVKPLVLMCKFTRN